jgi:1-acyl-sn-glycerol-3-phosphate acyltransferase
MPGQQEMTMPFHDTAPTGDAPLRILRPTEVPALEANERARTEAGRRELENYLRIPMPAPETVLRGVGVRTRLSFLALQARFLARHALSILRIGRGQSAQPMTEARAIHSEFLRRLGIAVRYHGEPVSLAKHGRTAIIAPNHIGYFDGPVIATGADAVMTGMERIARMRGWGPLARATGTIFVPRRQDVERGLTKVPGIEPVRDPVTGRFTLTPEQEEILRDRVATDIATALERTNVVLFPEGTQGPGTDITFFKPGGFRSLFSLDGSALPRRLVQPAVIDIESVGGVAIRPGYLVDERAGYAVYGWNEVYEETRLGHPWGHIMPRKRDLDGNRMVIGVHFLRPLDPTDFAGNSRDASAKALADATARCVRHALLNPPRSAVV